MSVNYRQAKEPRREVFATPVVWCNWGAPLAAGGRSWDPWEEPVKGQNPYVSLLGLCLQVRWKWGWGKSFSKFRSRRKIFVWTRAPPVFLPGESQGRGAWWAAVCGVTQSRTWRKRLSSSSSALATATLGKDTFWVLSSSVDSVLPTHGYCLRPALAFASHLARRKTRERDAVCA